MNRIEYIYIIMDHFSKMSHSCLVLALLCAAAAMAASAASGDVVSYSFPVFNSTTADGLIAGTNMSILMPAALLFGNLFPEFNGSEGFLLLPDTFDVWRAGAGGVIAKEASFNTSFTVSSGAAAPVGFVVLIDRYPVLNNPVGLRGNESEAGGHDGNATNSLVAVEVGTVRSYAPEFPNVGLNVTVTPNRTSASGSTVWIQYNAVAHRLSVYVAAAGEPRPQNALLDLPLHLAGSRTTETAFVGFFAAAIRDVVVGVRDWNLTMDSFHAKGKKSTSWVVILLAVLGSVAAAVAIVSVAVWYFVWRRRARGSMEPK